MKHPATVSVIFIALFDLAIAADASTSVKVAVVQLQSSKAGDFAAMLSYAKSAKAAGAEVIVFPETSDMGWLNPKVFYEAAPIPGTISDRFSAIAKDTGLWVVTGLTERGDKIATDPDTYEAFDSAILIDPTGRIVLHHRKYNVLRNAFTECPAKYGSQGCSYTPGLLSETKVAKTPFGIVTPFARRETGAVVSRE